MNTPSERAGWSREALAKIIDPDARWGGVLTDGHDLHEQEIAQRDALAKADAIMALAPPSSLDGGGEPLAFIIERGEGVSGYGKRREVVLVDEHDPRKPDFWLDGVIPDGYTITPLAALAAAPLPVGEQGNQGVSSDSGSPTPRRGSHTTDQRSTS